MSDGFLVNFLPVQTGSTGFIKHAKSLLVLRLQLNKFRFCLISVLDLCVGKSSTVERKILLYAYMLH